MLPVNAIKVRLASPVVIVAVIDKFLVADVLCEDEGAGAYHVGHFVFRGLGLENCRGEHHDAPESRKTLNRHPVPFAIYEVQSDGIIINDDAFFDFLHVRPHACC